MNGIKRKFYTIHTVDIAWSLSSAEREEFSIANVVMREHSSRFTGNKTWSTWIAPDF